MYPEGFGNVCDDKRNPAELDFQDYPVSLYSTIPYHTRTQTHTPIHTPTRCLLIRKINFLRR